MFSPLGQVCPVSDWINESRATQDMLETRNPSDPSLRWFWSHPKSSNLSHSFESMAQHTFEIDNIPWCCCRPGPSGTPAEQPFGLAWSTERWPSSNWGNAWFDGKVVSQQHCGPAADVRTAGWRSAVLPYRLRLKQTHQTTPELGILPCWPMGISLRAADATNRLRDAERTGIQLPTITH